MGRVHFVNGEKHTVEDQYLTPCDDRCTHAAGPKCDCHCGCKNHGSKRVIHVVRDMGTAPACVMPEKDKMLALAIEYRNGRDRIHEAWKTLLNTYNGRRGQRAWPYLDETDYRKMKALEKAYFKVMKLRTQKSRMKLIAETVL